MPPGPATKRACWESLDGDRLSALPEGLLHAVLSFLPAPQAVRTSVLSRRWRDLWRAAPCLSIDQADFGTSFGSAGRDLRQKWRKFEDFATNLLLFRSGAASLDTFQLCARGDFLRDVDRWVRRGIRYCPQLLRVTISGPSAISFPFPHLGASASRLKMLQLGGVFLYDRFVEQIHSACPVLEELEIWRCRHDFWEITSPTLKRLVINGCANLTGNTVAITTPYLEYLQISISPGCYGNGISACVTSSLVKAMISLLCEGETFSLENQRRLLIDLCNVPHLVLSCFPTKAMLITESENIIPVFCNMQTLSFEECFLDTYDLNDKLEALGTFLQNAPCLNKLTLESCMFKVDPDMEGPIRKSICLPRQGGKVFQCQKLKFIEVIHDADHDNQLIELLWGIGRMLPNATIKLTNSSLD